MFFRSGGSLAARRSRAAAAQAPAQVSRGVCTQPHAQAGRHVAGDRERRKAPRGGDRRAWGRRSRHGRLLRRASKAPLARHLTDCVGETHGPGGGGVSARVPAVWWRHPARKRRPAGAGSLRTEGSQAGEGQDGFARVKSAPHTPRRAARASARLSCPWPADRQGQARSDP